jgi:hypothetical protein
VDIILLYIPAWAWAYINKVTPQQWWYAINAAIGLTMFLTLMFSYYCIRRGLGHHKFKGKWFGPADFENLKQELYSGVRDGRLPDSETMRLLDRHVYGSESKFRKMSGSGWL